MWPGPCPICIRVAGSSWGALVSAGLIWTYSMTINAVLGGVTRKHYRCPEQIPPPFLSPGNRIGLHIDRKSAQCAHEHSMMHSSVAHLTGQTQSEQTSTMPPQSIPSSFAYVSFGTLLALALDPCAYCWTRAEMTLNINKIDGHPSCSTEKLVLTKRM